MVARWIFHGDVLGAGGWAKSVLFNERLSRQLAFKNVRRHSAWRLQWLPDDFAAAH